MEERIATVKKTSEILTKYSINPKPRYGQNFLVSPKIPELISNVSCIGKDSLVIEIGPGLGSLTQFLLEKSKKVICYEIDNQLSSILKETLKDYDNLEIIANDFLKEDLDSLDTSEYSNVVVVSNLPYYITSEILIKLLGSKDNYTIIAMMQKEVAQRIKNASGKDINELVLYSYFYSNVFKITEVSKNDFFPKPKVDSTVLMFEKTNIDNKDLINKIVNCLFAQRRKTIYNNLKHIVPNRILKDVIINKILKDSNLTVLSRVDELNKEEIINLINNCLKYFLIKAPAKINLGLKIENKINDYHNISSVYLPIDLYDDIEIYLCEDNEIDVMSNVEIKNEFVSKISKEFGFGIKAYINKNIPLGAGLGGGSSDAAAFIKYLKNLGLISDEESLTIAKQIGQDTVYFLNPKMMYLDNSVYDFKPIDNIDNFNILLITPDSKSSSSDAYNEFDESDHCLNRSFDTFKFLNNYKELIKHIFNDFENIINSKSPVNLDTFLELKKYNFDYIGMSGSGTSLYCLTQNQEIIDKVIKEIKDKTLVKQVNILK